MLDEQLKRKYLTEQPFHNLVNVLARMVADGNLTFDQIEDAMTVAKEKVYEYAAARADTTSEKK